MSNAVVAQDENEIITVMQNSLYPGANSSSVALVLSYCKAAHLDPMLKPVHIVPMWDREAKRMRDVIMPGIGLYRTMAARSGQYAGMTEPEFGPEITEKLSGVEVTYPQWCKITVRRMMPNGSLADFTAVERWKENYAVKGGQEKSIAPNAMWLKRPYGQIAKCAQAQALRIGFQELVPSQPTAEEMEGKDYSNVVHVVEPDKRITPTAGADERVTPERRAELDELGKKVTEFLNQDQVADAVMEIENAAPDADEKTYLWTLFDSKQRSAMKKELKRQRDEATAKAQAAAIERTKAAESGVINESQRKRLEARITESGIDRDQMKQYCFEQFGKEHFAELTQAEYNRVDSLIEDSLLSGQG